MSRFDVTRDAVLAHPLHRACELELLHAGEGTSELRFQVNDFTSSPLGTLHGGILYALLDVTCFFAAAPLLGDNQAPVTVETHSSMLRAAQKGESVILRGKADRIGRTLAAMRAEAYAVNKDGKERLIATGSVTKSILTVKD
ncbi:MAG: PaaI family thioesterase [Alcanivorax nanhaiticus]